MKLALNDFIVEVIPRLSEGMFNHQYCYSFSRPFLLECPSQEVRSAFANILGFTFEAFIMHGLVSERSDWMVYFTAYECIVCIDMKLYDFTLLLLLLFKFCSVQV